MSCWRTYTCDVLKDVSMDMVEAALRRMNLDIDTNIKHVTGRYERGSSDCDGVLVKNNQMIDMGVILNDGTGHLQLVGDFWGTGLNEATFQDELARAYQRINIETQAELNGWTIDEESVVENADGSVEMEVYMYA